MALVSALALNDVEYNGVDGRAFAKAGASIRVTDEECSALEALKAVERLKETPLPKVERPFRKRGY